MKFKNIQKEASAKGRKKKKSPSNSRTIPASYKFSFPKINHVTLFRIYRRTLKFFVIFIFIVAVIIVVYDLQRNLQIKQSIDSQREAIVQDLSFWEDFISEHQNYPDAYFKASTLEYKLGNMSKAKTYVEKGLVLDPNSARGKNIEKLLNM